MGASLGKTGQRTIKVRSKPQSRIDVATQELIKREFDRIQEAGTISLTQFKNEVLGMHVPDVIGNQLYKMFASPTKQDESTQVRPNKSSWVTQQNLAKYVMTYDDFCAFYIVFRDQRDEEMQQVVFEILKLSPTYETRIQQALRQDKAVVNQRGKVQNDSAENFEMEDLKWLCNVLQLENQSVHDYYVSSSYSHNYPICYDDWKRTYHLVKDNPLFSWVPTVVHGFREENMNLEQENEDKKYERTLTVITDERTKSQLAGSANADGPDDENRSRQEQQSAKLTSLEVDNIREFWNTDVKNKPAQEVHVVFRRMFKDMKSVKLKKYIFQSVSQVVGLTFVFLAELILNICKETSKEQRLTFLFNVFAKQGKLMKGQAIKDFIEVFRLPVQVFHFATFLTLQQLLANLENVEVDYTALLVVKPMMIAMTAITPETDEEERTAILAAMNWNKNLETFIYEILPEEQEFYVIEKDFWEQWSTALAITSDGAYAIKKEHKDFINNKSLMEDMHQFRMKDLTYKQDFVLLPRYVYFPLQKWYSCEKEITRTVIQYRRDSKFRESQSGFLSIQSKSQQAQRFMMSSQKFYNPKEQQYEDELIHKRGEFVFELEVYPCMLYLAMVSAKGDKPHIKAVVNGKVDLNYLRKVAHTDSLPFEELQVSRKTTMHQILQIAAQQFKQNIKRGRLLIENQVISGTQLFQTLEEFGIRQGQLMYAEFCNAANEFPTDNQSAKNKVAPKKQLAIKTSFDNQGKVATLGTTQGLQNLGNTCYMNSALQVIANLKVFHEYFVLQKMHMKQLNMRNPLGFQGQLAFQFGNLMESMWQQRTPVIPRPFKYTVARCCEQFNGYDQQDSQEYLSFMIDGLHEDLNLRMRKPYVKNPESENRELNELGLENWANSLLRNWSIIFFLFYGQMRSTLTCRQCRTESTTFDIFSNIPLSLPEPSQQTVSIIVYRVPNRVKDILQNKTVHDDEGRMTLQGFQRIETYTERDSESGAYSIQNSNPGGLSRMQSSQSNRDRQHLAQFAESYNYMNNDQPMRIMIKVDNEIKIADLITKIAQIRELNIETPLRKTEIVVFQRTTSNNLRGVMNPENKLNQYNVAGMDIMAAEILTRAGRDTIKKFYMDNPQFVANHPETVLRCLTYASEKGEQIEGAPDEINSPNIQRPLTGESEESSHQQSSQVSRGGQRRALPKIDKHVLLHHSFNNVLRMESVTKQVEMPKDIFVVAYHRRYVKKSEYLFQQYVPQLIANPLIFAMASFPSGRRIYDEVWSSAHVLLKPTSRFHRPALRWWEKKHWRETTESDRPIYAPFVLKAVDKTGFVCSLCHWTAKCSGCIIMPTDAPHFEEDFIQKCFIAIEWHSKTLSEGYNPVSNEVVEHASTRKQANEMNDQANYTTLDDCLTKFHKSEQLENETTCEKCKSPQVHFKRMEIFIPPPVLVIQLKRFQLYGNMWRKLQNLVDFPIKNLDLSAFTSDQHFVKEQLRIDPSYNLHGVVNHFGTLGFGHYVSYTRNPFDDKWYRYDDLYREEVTEDKINKDSAYLLFYIRKDVENKELQAIMPNIETDYFAGKPIKLSNTEGFVVENPPAQQSNSNRDKMELSVKLKTQVLKSTVQVQNLKPEEDKNEIEYTPQEQKVLARVNRGNSFDKDGNEIPVKKVTRGCCGFGGGGNPAPGSKKSSKKADPPQRRGSIKHSGAINQKRKTGEQEASPVQRSKAGGTPKSKPSQEGADSSSQSMAQPLINGNQSSSNAGRVTSIISPKENRSARNIERERTLGLVVSSNDQDSMPRSSFEGSIQKTEQPRPKLKVPEGMGPAMEQMSYQSEDSPGQNEGVVERQRTKLPPLVNKGRNEEQIQMISEEIKIAQPSTDVERPGRASEPPIKGSKKQRSQIQ